LALTLFFIANAACAEWQQYGGAGETKAYYDTARVRSEPPYITVWVRLEFDTPDTLNGKEYSSQVQKMAIDCRGEAWGALFSAFYVAKDSSGGPIETFNKTIAEVRMQPAIPNSLGDRLVKTICALPRAKK